MQPLLRWKSDKFYISEYLFVALIIQHAKRMRRIILSFVACPAVPDFSTLSHKGHELKKSFWTWSVCVCFEFVFKYGWNICLSKKNRVWYDNKYTFVFM